MTGITNDEQQLLAILAQHKLPELLQDLVRRRTDTNEQPVIEYLRDRWQRLGISFEITEAYPGRNNITATIGSGERSFLLNSHIDTVPPGQEERWTVPPFSGEIRDGRLYGRGAVDAKGCLAAMIAAFESLAQTETNGRLTLSAVAFEENGGLGTMHEVARGVRAEAAMIGEPTNLQPNLGHRGACRADVHVKGVPAHAAHPEKGVNAITAAAHVILALNDLHERMATRFDPVIQQRATLAVTIAHGGDAPNVIPAQCSLVINRRTLPSEDPKAVVAEIDQVVQTALANTKATYELHAPRQAPGAVTDPDERIANTVIGAIQDAVGIVPKPTGFFACCDMTYLSGVGIPTVIFGPGEETMCHVFDEAVSVHDLRKAAEVYALTAYRWFHQG